MAASILIVDDQPLLLDLLSETLRQEGYDVIPVADPLQALDIVRRKPSPDLVLSDLEMPQIRGTDLVREASQIAPGIGTVLMTGGDADLVEVPPGTLLLQKPISSRDLLSTVRTVLKRAVEAGAQLAREMKRSTELRRQRVIFSELVGKFQDHRQAVGDRVAPAGYSIRPNIELKLREELKAAQSDWLDAARELGEFCAAFKNGRATPGPERGATLARLALRQRASFERYQRTLSVLAALVLKVDAKDSASGLDSAKLRITKRELDVLKKLSEGRTTKQIADELNIAFKTASAYRIHLLQKFEAENEAVLIGKAILHGYIQPGSPRE